MTKQERERKDFPPRSISYSPRVASLMTNDIPLFLSVSLSLSILRLRRTWGLLHRSLVLRVYEEVD